jgi:hypothetical protein
VICEINRQRAMLDGAVGIRGVKLDIKLRVSSGMPRAVIVLPETESEIA